MHPIAALDAAWVRLRSVSQTLILFSLNEPAPLSNGAAQLRRVAVQPVPEARHTRGPQQLGFVAGVAYDSMGRIRCWGALGCEAKKDLIPLCRTQQREHRRCWRTRWPRVITAFCALVTLAELTRSTAMSQDAVGESR